MAGPQYLNPNAAAARGQEVSVKEKARTSAQEMQRRVDYEISRPGVTDPQYTFVELIGKGAFGRVYKG